MLVVFFALAIVTMSTSFCFSESSYSIETQANNYSYAEATLAISGNSLQVVGRIGGKPKVTTKTSIHLYLQQYRGTNWVNISNWISTGDTVSRTLSKTCLVEKGYKYRAKAVCYAYVGSNCEKTTKYSEGVIVY